MNSRELHQQNNLLRAASIASVITAFVLIAIKFFAWVVTGSVSILASLIDSVMDSAASLINFFAVRYSMQPPDKEHPFGHGKAEALAGLAQAAFITGSSLFLLLQAVDRLFNPAPLAKTDIGIAVIGFSLAATIVLVLFQKHVIRHTKSTAIEADSLHYVGDILVNISIIVALIMTRFGMGMVDAILGIVIAFYILYNAWEIGHRSIQLLLDHELGPEVEKTIAGIIAAHPEVLGYHELRTRESGRTQFIQLHIDLDRDITLQKAHDLAEEIELKIREAYPLADVIIHQDPA